jgi:hypothetical protein
MTFDHYKHLSAVEQASVLWEKGIQIGKRSEPSFIILLYQIEDFYVEMYLHKEENTVTRIRSFKSTGQLRPYLDTIDVTELISMI